MHKKKAAQPQRLLRVMHVDSDCAAQAWVILSTNKKLLQTFVADFRGQRRSPQSTCLLRCQDYPTNTNAQSHQSGLVCSEQGLTTQKKNEILSLNRSRREQTQAVDI